ncbi:MAG TPA: hydrogenase formation protein HypD [Deltaproteobacteria bacterium]|nr:hydrogenase formation protein HypD [Deltaproteobacteria bacterium]
MELDKKLLKKVIELSKRVTEKKGRKIYLMEVCGTHTTAISKSGLRSLISDTIELRSGPGCPVCVTDQSHVDKIIALARQHPVVIATFGDMVRVPGTHSSLERERARGAQVEIFYSPHEAILFAKKNPRKEIVFLGIGFETTAPAIAMSIADAHNQGIKNYSVVALHKSVPPVMRALLDDEDLHVDGFMLPGHVCTITGRKIFDFISSEYSIPAVIAGFETTDILQAIYLLLEQFFSGRVQTINAYTRLVHEEGNGKAKKIINEFFETVDTAWRGFGFIPDSGFCLKPDYAYYNAEKRFSVEVGESSMPEGCSCGDVLRGKMKPFHCPLFGKTCTPANPVGPCMVSSEGACAAYYNYSDW